jgi:hypothetical protein
VSHYNSDHGDTARTLDFQRTDIEYSAQRITCIKPILEDKVEAKDTPEQVSLSSNFHSWCYTIAFTFVCIMSGRTQYSENKLSGDGF